MKVITEEKQNIEANDLAALLNDCSIDAIIAFDKSYTIIAWNAAAENIYGTPKEDAIGTSIFNVIKDLQHDEQTVSAINKALHGSKSFVPASRQFKHRMHTENHYIPLNRDNGDGLGVMNIVHDVSHRIKAEQQLQYLNQELEKRYRQLEEMIITGIFLVDSWPLRKRQTSKPSTPDNCLSNMNISGTLKLFAIKISPLEYTVTI